MENISFTKMSGAGNDFIILKDFPDKALNPVLIQKLCDRRNGIGADGVINISRISNADFEMKYFNADGFAGTLCGNGSRCALYFAYSSGIAENKIMQFICGEKHYSGEILGDELVKFNLLSPGKIIRNFLITVNNKEIKTSFADTGSPHAVIYSDSLTGYFGSEYTIDEIPVKMLGSEIRYNKYFSPGGTNVNFVSFREGKIYIRTFERGVEDETLACGTGSVAAALISFLEKMVEPPVKIVTKSGEQLVVDFRFQNEKFENISLTGPAKITFTGDYRI